MKSTVVGVKVLELRQRLKVYRISFEKYLGEEKIELLKQEIELSIRS